MGKDVPLADAWTAGGAYVVELRCATEPGGGPGARVRLVLGEPGAGVGRVLPAGWAPRAAGVPLETDRVTIGLPRLTLRTRVPVTGQLASLGVRLALTDAADFSGLSLEPLAVSDVVQEAVLKIAEEGVEAAAVTVVAMRAGSAPGRSGCTTSPSTAPSASSCWPGPRTPRCSPPGRRRPLPTRTPEARGSSDPGFLGPGGFLRPDRVRAMSSRRGPGQGPVIPTDDFFRTEAG